ncbi:MAG: 3-dehydroquinate synthase [Gammaproteobacteria bacterium]|nr:3-dehydroquinate synthase [Gammaproteobacteria bacterium]NNM00648.1 3-dehydroquinate synthase [Gammaproteobacteria bacterium]
MITVDVDLGERSYPIWIGPGLLDADRLVEDVLRTRRVLIVTNEVVAPLYLEQTEALLKNFETGLVVLPDGEEHKTLAAMESIITALIKQRFARDTTLVALGGGVIGDITGFAAATYQRGIDFLQVPTTLLAQVDSSVGGKTAVNHPLGKNMVGAFHQPVAVLMDINTLGTLPPREFSAGLAEVIKYGLIRDAALFDWLELNADALMAQEPEALMHAIERSCINKAEIVQQDEREAGVRALLNLGHTFGHAVETGLGYGVWLHGEAVAAGMATAAFMAAEMGWMASAELERIDALLARCKLPTRLPGELGADAMLELMAVDKKVKDGELRLILPRAIGEAVISADFPRQALARALDRR